MIPRTKYHIVIKKIQPRRHNWLRYGVTVYWDRQNDRGDISWAYTLWGARREAQKLIVKHELPEEKEIIVEEYSL